MNLNRRCRDSWPTSPVCCHFKAFVIYSQRCFLNVHPVSSPVDRVSSNTSLPILTAADLLQVQKPAQYLGGEQNSVIKDDATIDVRFALAFPDTYEVGMSHVGLQILYHIINQDPAAWAERVFMPMKDMEELLQKKGAVLQSLESQRPLNEFDIIGFSLQYELCGTNILAMLELARIPLLASERGEKDPIIIGGGPYCYHPEALADFFDVFFLGDAEDAISEFVEVTRREKKAGSSRPQLLAALGQIEGVYVPSQFAPKYNDNGDLIGIEPADQAKTTVTRRLLPSMVGAPYPERPIVPNIKTIHNRLSIEVMRGCVRGCRFCQAGYLYRPQRERSPEEILKMIETSLPATGFEELSLLSLSTADYCSVVPLLKTLMDRYGEGDQLAISFPSTRVDALTPEVLEQVQRVRRTGFTVAPEAGTQRLRDVINKGVSDEQILETAGNVFRMGWTGIKMYFMLGLPTETDDDLRGIIDIARRVKQLPEAQGKDITVSVSTHVPKPHTPFQWAEQISPTETVRKQRLLADGLRRTGVNFRYHDAFSSFLEGVFCRGDRRVSQVLLRAYELGCRLDAWTEHLNQEAWLQAFVDCNIDPNYYLRERTESETLPWDHLSCGIPKSYFLKEYKRSLRDKPTADCLTTSCSICGACNYDDRRNVLWPRQESEQTLATRAHNLPHIRNRKETVFALRMQYRKTGAFAFLGHLELANVFHRSARRSEIPLTYTAGFHPMPRLAFGPPLQLGISSQVEYVDAFFFEPVSGPQILNALNQTLPQDLKILSVTPIATNTPSLQESFASQTYEIRWISEPRGIIADLVGSADSLKAKNALLAMKTAGITIYREQKQSGSGRFGRRKKTPKALALSEFIQDIHFVTEKDLVSGLRFTLLADPTKTSPKALDIAKELTGIGPGEFTMEKVGVTFKALLEGNAPSFPLPNMSALAQRNDGAFPSKEITRPGISADESAPSE